MSSRYVLLRVDAIPESGRSTADTSDDLRLGMQMLLTGQNGGVPSEDAHDLGVDFIERALPGITWIASGVWI